jgi:hypothetical protein
MKINRSILDPESGYYNVHACEVDEKDLEKMKELEKIDMRITNNYIYHQLPKLNREIITLKMLPQKGDIIHIGNESYQVMYRIWGPCGFEKIHVRHMAKRCSLKEKLKAAIPVVKVLENIYQEDNRGEESQEQLFKDRVKYYLREHSIYIK